MTSLNRNMSETAAIPANSLRHDWQLSEVLALLQRPFVDLMLEAQQLHRLYHDPHTVQLSTLLNIKSGGCPEDCAYCPQSVHFDTPVAAEPLLDVATVLTAAKAAQESGATRFCMGAAWRTPRGRNMERVIEMVQAVREMGMETCLTAGMLDADQAVELKQAGLDYYNHNLDTSEAYYEKIITTRTYQDRLDTLEHVRDAGLNVCSGGIIGMGESEADRAGLLCTLANLAEHPESVPINQLVKVEGTPLENSDEIDGFDMARTIAVARIMMPASMLRLSAGRSDMSDEQQALCFLAGANSIFYGEELLTTENPEAKKDRQLLQRLGMRPAAQ